MKKKHDIYLAAKRAATQVGYNRITRSDVAREAGCSEALVSHYFGEMDDLRRYVLQCAVIENYPALILQGVVLGHPDVEHLTDSQKTEIFRKFLESNA